jgi:hypothetical protein
MTPKEAQKVIEGIAKKRAASRKRLTEAEKTENRHFMDRHRFGCRTAGVGGRSYPMSRMWTPPEEKSLPPSSWPAFALACKKWGPPVGFRSLS